MLERDLQKRAKYLKKCKDNSWNRWKGEHLKSLRQRHNMRFKKENRPALAIGDLVIIKGAEWNRDLWRLEVVIKLFKKKGGIVRATKIRCGKSELQRAVQHLYPMVLYSATVSRLMKWMRMTKDRNQGDLKELLQPLQKLRF